MVGSTKKRAPTQKRKHTQLQPANSIGPAKFNSPSPKTLKVPAQTSNKRADKETHARYGVQFAGPNYMRHVRGARTKAMHHVTHVTLPAPTKPLNFFRKSSDAWLPMVHAHLSATLIQGLLSLSPPLSQKR